MDPINQISLSIGYGITILLSWDDDSKEMGFNEVREKIQRALKEMAEEEKIQTRTYLNDYRIFLKELLNNFSSLGFEMEETKQEGDERTNYTPVKKEFTEEEKFFRRTFGGDRSSLFDSIEILNAADFVANIALEEVNKSLPMEDAVSLGKKNENINA